MTYRGVCLAWRMTNNNITKTLAIKTAREHVSELYAFGENYRFTVYDAERELWIESYPANYWAARSARSEALIQKARETMGYSDGEQYLQYNGGSWTEYIGE